MALNTFFKRRGWQNQPVAPEKGALKEPKDALDEKKPRKAKARKRATVFGVIRGIHITEKASDMASRGQYAFRVAEDANKQMIAQSVEELYGVHAESVRVSRLPAKKIRRGRRIGQRPGYKKAIVSVRKGETIEVFN